MGLPERLLALDARLRELGSVLVAFSGGADSAFLLAAAVRALGTEHVVAATAVSPSLAQQELPAAAAFAESLGVRHLTPGTDEIDNEAYVANGADRCFHCKATLLDTLLPLAAREGLRTSRPAPTPTTWSRASGPASGRGPARGGHAARRTSRRSRSARPRGGGGWPTHDKPALACLASRLAYGTAVTPERLARVDRAEDALRALLDPTRRPGPRPR